MRRSPSQSCRIVEATVEPQAAIESAIQRVRRALGQIRYGEVIIKVEAGKPIWVDKFERERVG